MTSPPNLLDELAWRGMLYQHTDGAREALAGGAVTGYCGFDPTAESLHVGNLVPVMGLVHFQRAGHRPVALVGGGTGMIGDPSGKSAERQLLTTDTVQRNARTIGEQLRKFLDFDGPRAAVMRDNAEWLLALGAVEFMRDVGKHFTVNFMLAKESVRARMEAGISYTEFSYMLLQAYDYLELCRRDGATFQIGGSDQWGNITAGTELVRRVLGREAHGVTFPLMMTSAGTKFGKSEAGTAVWLDPEKTSPYQFYQFWVNTDDRDVSRFLRTFTLLSHEEIEALERAAESHPERREAQRALAWDVTSRVHGEENARTAQEISELLFGGAEPGSLSERALEALERELPFIEYSPSLPAAVASVHRSGHFGLDAVDMFAQLGLSKSKGEAKRLLAQGGMYANGRKLEDALIPAEALLPGGRLLLRRGARDWGVVRLRK